MKLKILFAALLLSLSGSIAMANPQLTTQSAQVDEVFDIYQAYDRAQKSNKPIYYVVTSASCPHCYTYLKNTIEPNFGVINRDFIFALSDLTKGDKIPSNLIFNGTTPTTYILSPNGQQLVSPIEGSFDSGYLKTLLNKLYEAFAQ